MLIRSNSHTLALTLMMASFVSQAAYHEMPQTAQPAASPSPWWQPANWQGFYAGVNAGGAYGHSNAQTSIDRPIVAPVTLSSVTVSALDYAGAQTLNTNAFNYGMFSGINFQIRSFVAGVEASFSGMNLDGSAASVGSYLYGTSPNFTLTQSVKTNWLFMVRPRLGYTLGHLLVYGTGGYALTDLNYTAAYSDHLVSERASVTKNRSGWLAGAGLEYQLASHWSLRGEYLYLGFGKVSTMGRIPAGAIVNSVEFAHKTSLSTQLVNFSLSYRF
jgi:outer membrane immunogenic protein